MLFESLKLARQTILRNALRSFLTVLGIIISVGAVIAMVTIGNSATAKVAADLAKLGSNLLYVRPGQFGPGHSSADAKAFTLRDVEAMRTQLCGIRAVAPVAQKAVTVIHGSESRNTVLIGTDNTYFTALNWELLTGRVFLEGEMRAGRAACLIGETVRRTLFGQGQALARSIRINKVSCEVIGVLVAKGQSSFGTDQDDIIVTPLRLFQRRISGNANITSLFVSAQEGMDTAQVQASIEWLLRERRTITGGKADDFSVRDRRQIIEAQTGATTVLTRLLGAVAGVSLLVGGIGIMNVMLVSVTERTREIGIRLAIGALEEQVLLQFMVEAVVISLFGGVVGILLGLGLAVVATTALELPFTLDQTIIVVAFAFSAMVGVVFGYFPARRAARLDPIEALRHE
ncbi:MAG: putative ABC transport system permease protein [Rhodospirillaceae bacterium]|nr:MAG: putative ABC transport system permease protein [Rhodospirillaceae bacterium]